ncbi:hypothetical protein BOTBODRAFT_589430 [Botryobasidium botryosum FD-172 SS1]|uniref:Protein kinase domain-containing protein n=1 Tax=Botryobasidium botryosum (strain FD-172 SS1) TaxID=930990 RepID=A0A067M7V8_BOTB1|nr:hypothetical protein BOTBODRAFT_589430 [Botryobasidium botryosum FD-172 SS1]
MMKTLVMSQQLRGGVCGPAFLGSAQGGNQVVVKFAHVKPDPIDFLLQEAYIYQHQLECLQGSVVPRHYGVFSGDRRVVLVTAYARKSLDSFEGLDVETKKTILDHIITLHRNGVRHGDVGPDNITMGSDGHPRVIDFSHASAHICPGVDKCQEIIATARMLGISDALSSYHEAPRLKTQ